ncbi:hypothetical protein ACKWTF_014804 [Chironomus riparius]
MALQRSPIIILAFFIITITNITASIIPQTDEVSLVLKAIYVKVNSRPLADLQRNQKILRFSNRNCVFNELNAVDDGDLTHFDEINWKGDRTLKIIEAVWYAAPLCVDFFEEQTEKYFEELKEMLRDEYYVKKIGCFKYGLMVRIPALGHPLLVGFDKESMIFNVSTALECENILRDFFNKFLNPQLEAVKIEMTTLQIQRCNESFYTQKEERKLNLLKIAIISNTNERVPTKYLKITKGEFRDAMKQQGRVMKDCILKDVRANSQRS